MNEVETIDVTPTWTALVPVMIAILTEVKNPKTIKELTLELLKMAEGADKWNEHVKELKEKEKTEEIEWTMNKADDQTRREVEQMDKEMEEKEETK